MKVKIRIPSRLHIGLCDLHPASLFSAGGIGLGLSEPYLDVHCTLGDGGVELLEQAVDWGREVGTVIERLGAYVSMDKLAIKIVSHFPAHCGFGSHTALALGVVEAVGLVSGSNWSEQEIIDISGRGGTSGIGIQTYFRGGLAYDYGTAGAPSVFLPSSARAPSVRPVAGPNLQFPENWQVLLALPDGTIVYGDDEIDFFKSHTPIGELDALRAIASVHHGVIPSIASSDLSSLGASLRQVHTSGLKALELKHQSEIVQNLYDVLVRRAFACGMSSFGPLVYAIVERDDKGAREAFEKVAKTYSARLFSPTLLSTGRKVSIL